MGIAVTALLTLAATAAVIHLLIRVGFRAPRIREQGSPAQLDLAYHEVSILSENGKRLFAWFIPAWQAARAPAVAILHGWGGNAEMMLPLAPLLHQAGYAVLLLDARNHGQSDGDSFSSMPRFAEDLVHALNWLAIQPGVDAEKLVALGHSVGAGAALLAASQRSDLAAVVSIAAFADPESMMKRFMAAHHVPYFPLGRCVLNSVQHTIGHRFSDIAPKNTIRQIRCPVLLVHGTDDTTVPVADAQEIYAQRLGDQVRLLLLAGEHDSTNEIERHMGILLEFLDQATGRKIAVN